MLPKSFAVAVAAAESTESLFSALANAAEPEDAMRMLDEIKIERTVTRIKTRRIADP
jgi:hypothetical protein